MSKHERSKSQDDVLRHPSTKRAKEVDADTPYEELLAWTKSGKKEPKLRNVLHWFRSKDLRAEDNKALAAASDKAREGSGALVTCYVFSPQDLEWHGTSPARVDFLLESLRLLQEQLHELNIPLVIETAETRDEKVPRVVDVLQEYDVSHVYANFEYEVDELRRDVELYKGLEKDSNVVFELRHDQTVVEPGTLRTGGGGPHKVFTPYHKAWLAEVAEQPDLLDTVAIPAANDKSVKSSGDLKSAFGYRIPAVPPSKQFASEDERKRLRKLWPAGHAAAVDRLQHFLDKKAASYAVERSNPVKDASSRISPYFAAGVLSVRKALTMAKKANDNSAKFDESGDPGVAAWVREVVFREFYRHVMVFTPHGSMNLPQNLKFDFVQWEDDEEGWYKWCEGRTGVPFVDAGMRQLNTEAYMHNRLRMNTSSYLRTNLLLDYRRGERYFAEHLVDWDLSNNTQGWEPSYTVFNPVSQAERNDPQGEYIRKWVPELKDVEGKAVFDPFHRLGKAEFQKLGYPEPHVDFQESKARCMERYKQDLADADP